MRADFGPRPWSKKPTRRAVYLELLTVVLWYAVYWWQARVRVRGGLLASGVVTKTNYARRFASTFHSDFGILLNVFPGGGAGSGNTNKGGILLVQGSQFTKSKVKSAAVPILMLSPFTCFPQSDQLAVVVEGMDAYFDDRLRRETVKLLPQGVCVCVRVWWQGIGSAGVDCA